MVNELIDQETGEMTRREKAIRAAAYVDSEGSFFIRKDGTAVITVTNTDRQMTDWLQAVYGGNVFLQRRPSETNQQPIWRWRISSMKAIRFLTEIEQFLLVKKGQANTAFEAQLARSVFDPLGTAKYFRAQMHELNRRGRR